MSLESNQKQGSPDLLELPPAYSEIETSSRVPGRQNNENRASNYSDNSERSFDENSPRSNDRDYHPASFLFGIPIIGLLARIVVGLEHSFRGHHRQGHHGNYWGYGHHNNHHQGHYYDHHHHGHQYGHDHEFDTNPFNNHHHSSHMNPFGY